MDPSRLQTLDRGLAALTLVAESGGGLTVAEIAARLGVARAIAYRIVATLGDYAMVHRGEDGLVRLGSGPMVLAARFDSNLRALARPVIEWLSAETAATAFLSVAQGDDCVAIATAESDRPFVNVGYRTGRRHPIGVGAAGVAILAARPERTDEPPSVQEARSRGYSVTRGQLQPGAVGVAAALRLSPRLHPGLEASIGVVAMEDLDVERAVTATMAAAERLSRQMHEGDAADE
ncbi:IclR family transcriptional regulator [Roseitranquillus sediminis]|uniref:IclR family transcriptional regulator n=1 Tax=Roseitranquillus sediminis TaxID=2809051 RepID=UPI001D0BF802|nr:helix-turn-helix domain-containing protein [Roseitranquillus sediminis]MBM9595402.1 helix-turn-helix domain-containing protein [Roseitranquillus sediminis]